MRNAGDLGDTAAPSDMRSDTAPLPAIDGTTPAAPARPAGPRAALAGLGLVLVAVVSGLVWWGIRADHRVRGQPEPVQASEDLLTSGEFTYAEVAGPHIATDCAANSYGEIAEWFADYPCERLVRGLFTTQVDEGRALVSVARVVMPEPNAAQQLKLSTDTDGTGNVADLIRDGTARLPGAPKVAGGAYASAIDGTEVTIVESAFFRGYDNKDLLARISADALRLGDMLR